MREAKIKKSSAEEFIDLLRQVCDQFPLQFASFDDEQKTIASAIILNLKN